MLRWPVLRRRLFDAAAPLKGAILGLMAAACTAGSGDGLDIGGRPLDEGGGIPLAPTLESLQANLFDPFCIVCHSGAAAPLGLRLDAMSSFTNLVGVPSRQSGALRVAPGDPDASYLVRKLEGTASEGERMPLGGPPVAQSTIDFVRQWILEGAMPAGPGTGGRPPAVVSLSPDPGIVLDELPRRLVVGFDRAVDAATVNRLSVELLASGADGGFGDGNEVRIEAASVSVSPVNPRLAFIALPALASYDDSYRIRLKGSGASLILGIDGLALDGDFDGRLPSGDGVAGGDFTALFEVSDRRRRDGDLP